MSIQLTRPLAFIDLETTGVNITADRIVEIAIVKIKPDGARLVKRKLINPEMPIPPQATAVHGISNEMVKDAPTFRQVANEVVQFLEGCDLSGYNSNRFDIPMLAESFLRVGIDWNITDSKMLDVQKIFHLMEQRTLSAAYKFYCNKDLDGAHSAEVDASATWEILQSQLQRYPQLGKTVDSIILAIGEDKIIDYARRFVFENGVEVFNFGKHKGRPVAEVLRAEPQYYDWMMKGDFPLHTKSKLTEMFNRTLVKNNKSS
ncbi:MAG: exonuclease domain-containing protein [Bacteroidota bacterium]